MLKFTRKKLFVIASGISVGTLALWCLDKPKSVIGSPFDFPITKRQLFSKATNDLDITLFQYQTCPFCCKVRSYLDYNGTNYKIVEVNSVTQKQLQWSEYKKVPVVLIKKGDNQIQVNDSSLIISLLESHRLDTSVPLDELKEFYPEYETVSRGKKKIEYYNKYHIMAGKPPENPETIKIEIKWRRWVDEVFVHTLSPNIYRTLSEALEAFNYVSKLANWEETFGRIQTRVIVNVGAIVMYLIGKRLKKRYDLKDDVRESLFEEAGIWVDALESRTFMGGKEPSLSDLAMYGVLMSIEGCSTFHELMENNTALKSWFGKTRASLLINRDKVLV